MKLMVLDAADWGRPKETSTTNTPCTVPESKAPGNQHTVESIIQNDNKNANLY